MSSENLNHKTDPERQSVVNVLEKLKMDRLLEEAKVAPFELVDIRNLLRYWSNGASFHDLDEVQTRRVSLSGALFGFSRLVRTDYYKEKMDRLIKAVKTEEKTDSIDLLEYSFLELDDHPREAFDEVFRFDESVYEEARKQGISDGLDGLLTDLQADGVSLVKLRESILMGKGERILTPEHLTNVLPTKFPMIKLEAQSRRVSDKLFGQLAQLGPDIHLLVQSSGPVGI